MSGLDKLKLRVNYYGDSVQHRYETDKLRSLKSALKYSFQSETVVLNDGREFLGLINPDKLSQDTDDKMLSIPFADICLNKPRIGKTRQGIEKIGLKPGDTFQWKETNTWWLVYMQRLTNLAYFQAEIRRCRHLVEIGGKEYHIQVKRPAVQSLIWNTRQNHISWNDMNYKLQLYITKDETTMDYFHRFTEIKIDGNTWQCASCDEMSVEGLIIVYLREYFNNTIKDAIEQEQLAEVKPTEPLDPESARIEGETVVYPYDSKKQQIQNIPADGFWKVDKPKSAHIVRQDSAHVQVDFITGKSDIVTLIQVRPDTDEEFRLEITVKSI